MLSEAAKSLDDTESMEVLGISASLSALKAARNALTVAASGITSAAWKYGVDLIAKESEVISFAETFDRRLKAALNFLDSIEDMNSDKVDEKKLQVDKQKQKDKYRKTKLTKALNGGRIA